MSALRFYEKESDKKLGVFYRFLILAACVPDVQAAMCQYKIVMRRQR